MPTLLVSRQPFTWSFRSQTLPILQLCPLVPHNLLYSASRYGERKGEEWGERFLWATSWSAVHHFHTHSTGPDSITEHASNMVPGWMATSQQHPTLWEGSKDIQWGDRCVSHREFWNLQWGSQIAELRILHKRARRLTPDLGMQILVWKRTDLWRNRLWVLELSPQPQVWVNTIVIREEIGITEVRWVCASTLPKVSRRKRNLQLLKCDHQKYLKSIIWTMKPKSWLCNEV